MNPKRIAIFRGLFLGDLLLAVPAWRALRRRFPMAEITLIALPWAEGLAARYARYIDRFVPFPGYPGLEDVPCDRERTEDWLAEQRAYTYDLALQMHGSGPQSNRLILDLGARMTAGFYPAQGSAREGGEPPLALTIAAPYPIHLSEIERNLELARLVGCGETSADLEFPLWDNDRRQAQALLGDVGHARLLVGLHSGAKRPVRRWPAAHFARLGDLLSRRLGATVILTGGPQEAEPLAVQALMREPALNLAGRTTVPVLAALIERSDLLIANDTGPAHLADAVGTPAITLMGPADVSRWRSSQPSHVTFHLPVPCSPCACWECPIDQRCLRWIEPEAVLSAARDVVENGVAA